MTGNLSGQPPAIPRRVYTSWSARVAAFFVDMVPLGLAWGIWEVVALRSATLDCVTFDNGGVSCSSGISSVGYLAFALTVAVSVAYLVWNYGHRQGVSGSSVGKSVLRFQVLDEKTWRPVGFGASVLRQAVHLLDAAVCFIGFLFPLWDRRRQTLADKLTGTVCVPKRY